MAELCRSADHRCVEATGDGRSAGHEIDQPPCGERRGRAVRAVDLDGLQHGALSENPSRRLPHEYLAVARGLLQAGSRVDRIPGHGCVR